MRTLKLTIAYDGTDFAGWQRQAAARTVQAALEDALAPIEGRRVIVTGAGRTDAGVHAAAQVASVRLDAAITPGELRRALNATLDEDVRVLAVEEVHDDFHARFDARSKSYRYAVCCGEVMPPRLRRYAWHVRHPLDVDAMQSAAALVVGEHDFAAFQAAGSDVQTSVRRVLASAIEASGASGLDLDGGATLLHYHVTGTGFLRHMVRNIAGTLVDVGIGRRSPDDIRAILASRDRARASATAPAHGLTLLRVSY